MAFSVRSIFAVLACAAVLFTALHCVCADDGVGGGVAHRRSCCAGGACGENSKDRPAPRAGLCPHCSNTLSVERAVSTHIEAPGNLAFFVVPPMRVEIGAEHLLGVRGGGRLVAHLQERSSLLRLHCALMV